MSDQLKIDNQIKLMNILEDFVIKNIKYPLGDQTNQIQYYKSLGVDLGPNRLEYSDKVSELDKQNIYAYHSVGRYKETEQQKTYRNSAVQKIRLSNDPSDTIEIPLIDRLPRHYDDILTDIKNFNSYIKSQKTINLKQIEKLRKKAFHTYAMHNDCQSLEVVPKEILEFILKNQTGIQRQRTIATIKQAFLQFTEEVLLDEEKINKYIEMIEKNKSLEKLEDEIIKQLESDSIPFVKEVLVKQRTIDIERFRSQIQYLENTKKILLTHYQNDPDQPVDPLFIFKDHNYADVTINKLIDRIQDYEIQIDEFNGVKPPTRKSMKKFTGASQTWLRQHKPNDQSLYKMIKEKTKNHKKCAKLNRNQK